MKTVIKMYDQCNGFLKVVISIFELIWVFPSLEKWGEQAAEQERSLRGVCFQSDRTPGGIEFLLNKMTERQGGRQFVFCFTLIVVGDDHFHRYDGCQG